MYRVLIVDDEPIFRLGIRSCVDWASLGFAVAGEAENGQKALQMIQQFHPELIFLDIRMPIMDGIQVLQWISAHAPDTQVVVLSCLNEYEYVRRAMRLGALDYLFKPLMEAADIRRVADEALQRIRSRSSAPEAAQPDGSRLIRQLNQGALSLSAGEVAAELSSLGLSSGSGTFLLCALHLYFSGSDDAARREQVGITAQNLLLQELSGRCAGLGEQRTAILLALTPDCEPELPALCRRIREYTGVPAAAGLSGTCEAGSIQTGVRQALDALSLKFVHDYGSVIPWQEPACQPQDCRSVLDQAQPRIEAAIDACDTDRAMEILEQSLQQAISLGCCDRETLCRFASGSLLSGIRAWRGRAAVGSLLTKHFDDINRLSNADTIFVLLKRFRQLLQALLTDAGLDPDDSVSPAVRRVQKYVGEHYDQNITLDQAAELVHMNKNYFCKLFKKETGDNFIAYLTKVRIEHAIPLLMDGRWPAYQVAEMVGYNNYRYFCKIYKKYTGVTPGEIRHPAAPAGPSGKE